PRHTAHSHPFPTRRSSDLRILQDHRDRAAADPLHLVVGLLQEIVAVEEDRAADDARGRPRHEADDAQARHALARAGLADEAERLDRKSTRLNSSHVSISYA